MAESGARVAVKVPECLGLHVGVGCKPGVPPLATGGEAQVPDEFSQHFHSIVFATVHQTAELMASKGVPNVVVFLNSKTAQAKI
jgi:hypothetical protein